MTARTFRAAVHVRSVGPAGISNDDAIFKADSVTSVTDDAEDTM